MGSSLEGDVLLQIFKLLPPHSLAQCSAVCTHWHQAISNDNVHVWNHVSGIHQKKLEAKYGVKSNERTKDHTLAMEQYIRFAQGLERATIFAAHSNRVNCCHLSMDTLATGSSDNTVKVWSVETMKCMEEYRVPKKMDVTAIHVDGGRIMAAAGTEVHVWKRGSIQALRKLGGHNQRLFSLRDIDPEVAVGCGDGTVRVYDLYTGNCSLMLRHHTQTVTSIALVTSLNALATGSHDGTVKLCDPASGEITASYILYPRHLSPVSCIQMLQHDTKLVAGTLSGSIHCWDIRKGSTQALWTRLVANLAITSMDSQEEYVSLLLAGCYGGRLRAIDTSTGEVVRTLEPGVASVNGMRTPVLAVAAGFTRAVTCHANGEVVKLSFDL